MSHVSDSDEDIDIQPKNIQNTHKPDREWKADDKTIHNFIHIPYNEHTGRY